MINEVEFENIFMKKIITDKAYLSAVYSCGMPAHEVAEYPVRDENKLLLSKVLDYFGTSSQLPTLEIIKVHSNEREADIIEKAWKSVSEVNDSYEENALMFDTVEYLRARALNYVIVNASHGRISGEEVAEKAGKAVGINLDKDVGYDIDEDIDKFCEKMTKPNSTITTGYEWLDKQLGGGWVCGEPALYTFAGETNVGKSVFLMQFAIAAYKAGKNVLIVSLEMSEFMYTKRVYSNLTQIGMNDLANQVDDLKDAVENRDPLHGKLVIKQFPTGTLSVPQLETYLEDLARSGFKPDVIFVDYLNLMTANMKDVKKYEEVGMIAVGLRRLSYMFAPIVTATQLNRSGMGRAAPELDKTASSIEGAFCTDFQAGIWQLPEDRAAGIIKMVVQKTRFGDKGSVKAFGADFSHMTIRELSDETEEIASTSTAQNFATTPINDFNNIFQ